MTNLNLKNTTIIILCAGEATRWNNYLGIPKQLITIGGEPLLERTIRLLHSKGLYDINIVSLNEQLKIDTCSIFKPLKYQWIVETLLSTQSLWNENTIILLGDVFFTQKAINTIVSSRSNIHIYGRYEANRYTSANWGEIFALSFKRSDWHQLIKNTKNIIYQAKLGGNGKLWTLYRSLAGFPLEKHQVENKIFISIDDFTDDFDFPSEYDSNIRKYEYLTSSSLYKKILVYIWIKYIDLTVILKNILRSFKTFLEKSI